MAIERTLTADEFKKYPANDQALYSKADDGTYEFVGENASELRRSGLRHQQEADKIAKERDALKLQIEKMEQSQRDNEHDERMKSADVKDIDAAWKVKHTKELQARDERINRLTQVLLKQRRDAIVNDIAEQIALPSSVHLVKLILRDRIDVTIDENGETQPVIYDEERKVTRDTLKDLTKSIQKDKRNEHILKGANVGSGATKAETPVEPSPVADRQTSTKDQFAEYFNYKGMSAADKVKFLQSRG